MPVQRYRIEGANTHMKDRKNSTAKAYVNMETNGSETPEKNPDGGTDLDLSFSHQLRFKVKGDSSVNSSWIRWSKPSLPG
jgi:hypothetical protein